MQPSIEAKGVQRTHAALVNVGKRGGDVRPITADVRAIYLASNEQRFDTRGEGSWPPLKASTRAAKRRKGLDPRVLRASGALHASLTKTRAKKQVTRKKTDQFKFGTSVFYGQFHDRGDGGVPERKLIDLTARDLARINDRLEAFIAHDEREIQSML